MVERGIETTSMVTEMEDAMGGESETRRLPLEPLDPQLTDIQPGGGLIKNIELLWGNFRRWYLKRFRKAYVARMKSLRKGSENRCPHEVLDPRDVKYYRNQTGYDWERQDDPFAWRDNLPFARVGFAELLIFSILSFGVFVVCCTAAFWTVGPIAIVLWCLGGGSLIVGLLIVWFFRDPRRNVPQDVGVVVAPADGKIATIEEIDHDEFIGGPAVVIGIFLSIFNVHLNRVPVASRVIGLTYRRGKFLNALRPESARENEQLAVRLEENSFPYRRMVVKQIAGAIARRIVCWAKPGDELQRGDRFGMIKLGSRTELVIPQEDGLRIAVRVGDKVQAGASVMAVYGSEVSGTYD